MINEKSSLLSEDTNSRMFRKL